MLGSSLLYPSHVHKRFALRDDRVNPITGVRICSTDENLIKMGALAAGNYFSKQTNKRKEAASLSICPQLEN